MWKAAAGAAQDIGQGTDAPPPLGLSRQHAGPLGTCDNRRGDPIARRAARLFKLAPGDEAVDAQAEPRRGGAGLRTRARGLRKGPAKAKAER